MNQEYTNAEPGAPDPIRAAFDNHQRAPSDRVKRGEPKPADDVIALRHTRAAITHLTNNGPFTEHVTIGRAIMPKPEEGQRR
ncbi:hypothetical protein H7K38_23855 [Mycobacterium alsense]|uniref:Uncharacterized protein n=1 Tax=Mycobacterium alsense TaxID=324058 RepID=A0AA42C2T9_9MYCO|nr:hypothetical protein [Mycobacterium alsense]MCV7381654.1 hypothetical protein [Mycobacterium alsense]